MRNRTSNSAPSGTHRAAHMRVDNNNPLARSLGCVPYIRVMGAKKATHARGIAISAPLRRRIPCQRTLPSAGRLMASRHGWDGHFFGGRLVLPVLFFRGRRLSCSLRARWDFGRIWFLACGCCDGRQIVSVSLDTCWVMRRRLSNL